MGMRPAAGQEGADVRSGCAITRGSPLRFRASPADCDGRCRAGQCEGAPGDPGWEIRNHTGGGGPGFQSIPGFDLSEASANECRARCCANPHCASVTIGPYMPEVGSHECWLNPAGGVAPFAQETTLMAFVKRANATARREAAAPPTAACHYHYPERDPR